MAPLSLWRLLERSREHVAGAERAIWLFLAQLALNAAWAPIFFGLHAIWSGLLIIVALAIVLVITINAAFRVDRPAAWMLVPYLAWIGCASSLNARDRNPQRLKWAGDLTILCRLVLNAARVRRTPMSAKLCIAPLRSVSSFAGARWLCSALLVPCDRK